MDTGLRMVLGEGMELGVGLVTGLLGGEAWWARAGRVEGGWW